MTWTPPPIVGGPALEPEPEPEVQYPDGLPAVRYRNTYIPRGAYAVHTPTPEYANDVTFFDLWIGSEDDPKWRDRMSLGMNIGPDRVKVPPYNRPAVFDLILEQGLEECARRYGREIGKCGICGRRLTNDESRAAGIGPVCRSRWWG